MKPKYLFTFSVALIGATSAFSQTLNSLPSRVLGHPNPEQLSNVVTTSPNLVEGRELYQPQGLALDTSVTPAILYVADTLNNRVLAWKNALSFTNGQMADLVIGQNDRFSTFAQGPAGNTLLTGFASPSGLAVYKGDLYVVDSGNNRILRFPKPFSQTQSPPVPDLVIGQPNLTSRGVNYGTALNAPTSAQGIATASSTQVFQAGLAFDTGGNLWFTDVGNARVLRFPAGNIPAPNVGSTVGGIAADLVIGQPSLTTINTAPLSSLNNFTQVKNQFGVLATLAFDSIGRLYVVDDSADGATSTGRVLVFAGPAGLVSGSGSADRVMGVVTSDELKAAVATSTTAAQTLIAQTFISQPQGVFFLPDNSVAVVDSGDNRIAIFPSYDKWPPESTSYSPVATSTVGQGGSFTTVTPNSTQSKTIATAPGTPPPSSNTLWAPAAAVLLASGTAGETTTELFVADAGNNRILAMPFSGGAFQSATRVLGQDVMDANSPNLIEGREFNFASAAGIALDSTGSTPHLYVADTLNNRVLGYYDARLVTAGKRADIVIGQPDFAHALCNYNLAASNGKGGDPSTPTVSSLCLPIGLAVDAGGYLYVADSGNGRVLRFPTGQLFANYPKVVALPQADLVLGQAGFQAQVLQASSQTMTQPYGLAFSGTNGLLVSDSFLNRVLYFQFNANGTFTAGADNGRAATKVFGQPDFVSRSSGSGAASFKTPTHVASDGEGNFYVADYGNNRISVFPDPNSAFTSSGQQSSLAISGLAAPRGVFVDHNSDEIWIANTGLGTCLRYFNSNPIFPGQAPDLTVPAVSATMAIATDQNGALYVADASNRIAIYYPALQTMNGANFLADRPLAPAMIASLCAPGSNCANGQSSFGSQTAQNSQVPIPTVLGDIQVNFNNTPAPLFYVSPAQINFYVPSNAPTTGNANVEVIQKSTGQVIAAGLAPMSNYSPGIFTQDYGSSTRQAAVLNQDNSINSSKNPAARGSLVQIFATGQGAISGLPSDGVPAASNIIVPKGLTQVLIGGCILSEGSNTPVGCGNQPGDVGSGGNWIPFTGLVQGTVGLWQVNAQIPMQTAPGVEPIEVLFHGTFSADTAGYKTVIYVK